MDDQNLHTREGSSKSHSSKKKLKKNMKLKKNEADVKGSARKSYLSASKSWLIFLFLGFVILAFKSLQFFCKLLQGVFNLLQLVFKLLHDVCQWLQCAFVYLQDVYRRPSVAFKILRFVCKLIQGAFKSLQFAFMVLQVVCHWLHDAFKFLQDVFKWVQAPFKFRNVSLHHPAVSPSALAAPSNSSVEASPRVDLFVSTSEAFQQELPVTSTPDMSVNQQPQLVTSAPPVETSSDSDARPEEPKRIVFSRGSISSVSASSNELADQCNELELLEMQSSPCPKAVDKSKRRQEKKRRREEKKKPPVKSNPMPTPTIEAGNSVQPAKSAAITAQTHGTLDAPLRSAPLKVIDESSQISSAFNASDLSKYLRPSCITAAVVDGSKKKKLFLPLNPPCEFRLMCRICFKPNKTDIPRPVEAHTCCEEMLVVKQDDTGVWVRIRERINHKQFLGPYERCIYFFSGTGCFAGNDCTYAHSAEEQTLWTLEKAGEFDIAAFIAEARTAIGSLFTVESILTRYPGQLLMLCRKCLFSERRLTAQNQQVLLQCTAGHDWAQTKLLAHFDSRNQQTLVYPRPKRYTYFLMCRLLQFCNSRETCDKAHSALERDVWYMEHDSPQMTNEELVEQSKKFVRPPNFAASSVESARLKCPYQVIQCCKLCLEDGGVSERSSTAVDRCRIERHQFEPNKMFLILPSRKRLDKMPDSDEKMCSYIESLSRCTNMGGSCTFAHSKEELEVWTWMKEHGVTEREKLLNARQSTAGPGNSSSSRTGPAVPTVPPLNLNVSSLFCRYCGETYRTEKQLEEHCASAAHKEVVNSDKEHQWNHRPPPLRVQRFTLCQWHKNGMRCPSSHVPEANNLCDWAHSEEELDEWNERHNFRLMKRSNARKEKLFSYIDQLSDDFEKAESGLTVMSESLEYVDIECTSELSALSCDKHMKHSWTFSLSTTLDHQLKKVALLDARDSLHFSLTGGDIMASDCQLEEGDKFLIKSQKGTKCAYAVSVQFVGGLYGSFRQWVTFDFGQRPVLFQKITMELGSGELQEKVASMRKRLQFDRWTSANRKIVRDQSRSLSELNAELLVKYKPSSTEEAITQDSVVTEINKNNYVHRMHSLLNIEELEQARIVANYNMKTTIDIINAIEGTTHLFSAPGELFAKLQLNTELNHDTDAGNLLLRTVNSVLLAKSDNIDRVVYEANIVTRDNDSGRGRDYLYLSLSKRVCEALELKKDSKLEVEIQFQMDRFLFCQMHRAVDNLENNLEIVFPDPIRLKSIMSKADDQRLGEQTKLNQKQLKIMQYCCQTRKACIPPLVVYGPFGTGKTEAMAQSAILLARGDASVKVLICTHTNWAADEYILHRFNADSVQQFTPTPLKILRVYDVQRRLDTVHSNVRPFCLLSENRQSFRAPTECDIRDSQIVVVTLVGSLALTRLNIRGAFSHVFVDEAAQVDECQAIMPFSLVGERTCVVLAGDHKQMGQKVYSAVARQQNFHLSIIERLLQHYKNSVSDNVFLIANYRNHSDINQFAAKFLYGYSDSTVSPNNSVTPTHSWPALNFYATQGCEVQDPDSTSFYNLAEIHEVVERVDELYQNWPLVEWGERKADSILVTAPYAQQISLLRMELRKRNLGQITVLRTQNVPGLEFQAVFVSVVRTRHLTKNPAVFASGLEQREGIDFGFLSEPKLVNSALTRAKSFIAVIGDPVALCSIGECKKIWTEYLKNSKLHPTELTCEKIRQQCESVNGAYQLPRSTAAQLVCKRLSRSSVAYSTAGITKSYRLPSDGAPLSTTLLNVNAIPWSPETTNLQESHLESANPDYWTEEHRMEPDEIIRQLVEEALKTSQSKQQPQVTTNDTEQPPIWQSLQNSIFIQEQHGHARHSYQQARYQGAPGDPGDDYTIDRLQELLRDDPRWYKRCVLDLESPSGRHAKPLDPPLQYRRINLASRKKCGRGFHGDEVVVEVISEIGADGERTLEPYGVVKGILQHSMDPRNRLFVCQIEQYGTGIMVPLNMGIPKIRFYDPESRGPDSNKRMRNVVPLYSLEHENRVFFQRYEDVNPLDQTAKLFVVRFLKWLPGYSNPLGIVIDVMEPGNSIPQAMRILNIDYNIPTNFPNAIVSEVSSDFGDSFEISRSASESRLDIRDRLVFTIDPPESTDLDDALSVEIMSDGRFVIGVHIADVSFYVKQDSSIDKEAERRGTAYYPYGFAHIPMLPRRLSSDLCSLLPGVDRLTVSVFFTIDCSSHITQVEIKRCTIKSQFRLTYAEAEFIIVGKDDIDPRFSQDLIQNIRTLSGIARTWAKRRLGTGASMYNEPDMGRVDAPNAHMMIQEFMIATNHQVALRLHRSFRTCVPLRQQAAPNDLELDEWRKRFSNDAWNSVALSRPYWYGRYVCHCTGLCSCISGNINTGHQMEMARSMWNDIFHAVRQEDIGSIRSLTLCPEYHPQLSLALLSLQMLNTRSQYVCSGNLVSAGDTIHYSLNLDIYVHFTSPIRRYIDLVTHRLLIAAINQSPCPYSQSRITEICMHCTDAASRAKKYEEATSLAQFCCLLQNRSIVLYPIVYKAEDVAFQLRFPMFQRLIPNRTAIPVSALNPSAKPITTTSSSAVGLQWSQRIYDLLKLPDEKKSKDCETIELNAEKYIAKSDSCAWRCLVQAIIADDWNRIVNAVNDLGPNFASAVPVENLTSEGVIVESHKHFCQYSLSLHAASIVEVQLATELNRGLLVPTVQLLCLTDTAQICVEHNKKPVECFADVSAEHALRDKYENIEQYQGLWLPVLAIASSSSAVKNEFSSIIHHVIIKWRQCWSIHGLVRFQGSFKVPVSFCKERYIQFFSETKPVDDDANETNDYLLNREKCLGFVCVRYTNLKIPIPPVQMGRLLESTGAVEEPMTWVGHCVMIRSTTDSDSTTNTVHMRLNQRSSPLPRQLLSDELATPATIEWIAKSTSDRRMEEAIVNLSTTSEIVQDIALGRDPQPLDSEYIRLIQPCLSMPIPDLNEPNRVQSDAIRHAMSRPFSLILGPPGTGKTVVAARIAYMFAHINKTLGPRYQRQIENGTIKPQVMVCGPSNKSADVVIDYFIPKHDSKDLNPLMAHKIKLKVVRVYSTKKEQLDYPIPRQLVLEKPKFKLASKLRDDTLRSITLHHMIRDDNENPHSAEKLRAMDRRIQDEPDSVTDDEVTTYREDIAKAELYVLRQADIIFMTCSASGAHRTRLGMNVLQLIIDECGMCTEPESFVPLVKTRPKHIVLVGDDKQLRPIIPEHAAAKRGLDRSLFTRYSESAFMLTLHYRMHMAIAEFPSEKFYMNRLEVGSDKQCLPSTLQDFWPGGQSTPIAFVHVVGVESSLAVSTDEGGAQSKSNWTEVQLLIRIVKAMLEKHQIEQKQIAVLSQYRAQCADITKMFVVNKWDKVTVQTVVASQGSQWEYVILSTVRSLPEVEIESDPSFAWKRKHLGFIADQHQANVAITRAQKGLVILGNKSLLRCNNMWDSLISHYENKNAVINATDFIRNITA